MRRSAAAILLITSCLVLVGSAAAHASFPGKNGRIAYTRNFHDIYTIAKDGSDRTRLTTTKRAAVSSFWSPDGSKLVFQLNRPDENCGAIMMMNADGTGMTNLTSVLPRFRRGCWNGPSFTANGRSVLLAFESNIWSLNLHGRDPHHLIGPNGIGKVVPGDRTLSSPRQLPGTRTLAFVVEHFGPTGVGHKGVFTMQMSGGRVRKIVPFSMDVNSRIDVSPNGRRIVFTSHDHAPPPNVLTIRPDGSGVRHLTHFRSRSIYVQGPSYSPNGRWIVFGYANGDRAGLRKMRSIGGPRMRVRNSKVFVGGTSWGPLSA